MVKVNKKTIMAVFLGFLLISLINLEVEEREEKFVKIEPISAGSWAVSYIHVLNNWSSYTFISGNGSWSQPYLIENVTVDATSSPTGSGILIEDSKEVYFKIKNCTVSNWGAINEDGGIKLLNSDNGIIENNTCSSSSYSGIVLLGDITGIESSNNNTIINNTCNNNAKGVFIELFCENNTIFENEIHNNVVGVDLFDQCEFNNVTDNYISGNTRGIGISYSSNYNDIKLNELEVNTWGIYIQEESDNNLIYNNTILDSTSDGIFINGDWNKWCYGNIIENNYISGSTSSGIYGEYSDNTKIINNTLIDNSHHGIEFYQKCQNNHIQDNLIISNGDGIIESGIYMWPDCVNNQIIGNIIKDNWEYGIIIGSGCSDNEIRDNDIKGHDWGVRIAYKSNSNDIIDNNISECSGPSNPYGILVELDSIDNLIDGNIINNTGTGIILYINATNTDITDNLIVNCATRGIYIQTGDCDFGEVWLNTFVDNSGENARDNSGIGDTNWDKGGTGNYWDDYNGYDCNSDGIGETAYTNIAGSANSQDNYPLWTIADPNPPVIFESKISDNELFGNNAPIFNLDISEYEMDQAWIRLWNGTILTSNNTFTYNQGIDTGISSSIWDQIGNGSVTISFYANDTCGNIGSLNISVRKDILAPILTIVNPINNTISSIYDREFNFTLEGFANSLWYSIEGGEAHFFSTNGTFDQINWETAWNETTYNNSFEITFYVNYSIGYVNSFNINIIPDKPEPIIDPVILILQNPLNNTAYGIFDIEFNYTIEGVADTLWYSIEGGDYHYFTENGTFDQTDWEVAWNETPYGEFFEIIFYANNSQNDVTTYKIIIIPDKPEPDVLILTILNPENFSVIGISERNFQYMIQGDVHLLWYTIEGGQNHYFTENGTFEQIDWELAWDETAFDEFFEIKFYANDTLGNEISVIIQIYPNKTEPEPIETTIPFGFHFLVYMLLSVSILTTLVNRKTIRK